jgi:thiamine biosynthesis lipoprotein
VSCVTAPPNAAVLLDDKTLPVRFYFNPLQREELARQRFSTSICPAHVESHASKLLQFEPLQSISEPRNWLVVNWPAHSHEAMATTFQIVIAGKPPEYARQAAAAAFRELDRLTAELSRYVETSDIAQANRLAPGESLVIGDDTLQCLVTAAQISELTGGAFDPAYASIRAPDLERDAALFALDPGSHTLTSLTDRLHLDLGAVGKGYALDRLAETLREWDIASACLHSGGSTVLALEPPPDSTGWSVGIESLLLPLAHRALSGSGIAVKGRHLIDPRNGLPAERTQRVWSFADNAAEADALSTAFFVMTDLEIAAFCRSHPHYGAVLVAGNGALVWHGARPGIISRKPDSAE